MRSMRKLPSRTLYLNRKLTPSPPSTVPEWRTFQKRNADIERAAANLRAKYADVYTNVSFYSEGTRCSGSIWRPKTPLPGNPAILVCHGWGGLCAFLDVRYASKFAEEGFHVMSFDYRTWGHSDGVIVPAAQANQDLQQLAREQDFKEQTPVTGTAQVRVLRQVVDMNWQLADIEAAISFFTSYPHCRIGRLGLWGTSLGGGHVLEQTAREDVLLKRVSAVVAQVPSVGRNGAGDINLRKQELLQQVTQASQHGWIPSGAREYHLSAMDGSPILRSLDTLNPLLSAHNIKHSAVLVIDSDREELWDVKQNGLAAFNLAQTVNKEHYMLKDADHYDAYNKSARESRSVAIEFFKKHLCVTLAKI